VPPVSFIKLTSFSTFSGSSILGVSTLVTISFLGSSISSFLSITDIGFEVFLLVFIASSFTSSLTSSFISFKLTLGVSFKSILGVSLISSFSLVLLKSTFKSSCF